MTAKTTLRIAAIVLGVAASVLAVMAVTVYEGYFPADWADHISADELGGLSALAVVAAIGASWAEKEV